jgi:hypothetical protein
MFLKLENFIIYVSLCNSIIHVITLYSGHVCVYYGSMLRCWHLVRILVRTDHPCLGVGCHILSPLGELTSMVCFMVLIGRLYFATKLDDMNECDAPESNKTVAGCELGRNIPNITSWAC